jgi:heme oxygenase
MDIAVREILRAATQAPHQRLHHHAGFARVADGTITLAEYRALLGRLYGFYLPFESALGLDPIRTQWLTMDLAWLGGDAAALSRLRVCATLPAFDGRERQLGAQYVSEGAALGGRQLCRGLDGLLGGDNPDGRRFFAGRGAATGAAWSSFLDQIATIGQGPFGRAALVAAALETFERFECWLDGWREET